jgi:succinate-acetate transporter protein
MGGYAGITCGVLAWYVAFAHVTNATFGRELIPTWPLSAPAPARAPAAVR